MIGLFLLALLAGAVEASIDWVIISAINPVLGDTVGLYISMGIEDFLALIGTVVLFISGALLGCLVEWGPISYRGFNLWFSQRTRDGGSSPVDSPSSTPAPATPYVVAVITVVGSVAGAAINAAATLLKGS